MGKKKPEAYDLMPPELAATLPRLYATDKEPDPLARVKYFTPDSSWTWYVTEYDPTERRCFGLVVGQDRELGYFLLDEMEAARGPHGLPVERDLFWEPTPLSKCR